MNTTIVSGTDMVNDYISKWKSFRPYTTTDLEKRPPRLAIIQVGDNPASNSYIRNKIKLFEQADCKADLYKFDSDATDSEVKAKIRFLNEDNSVDGIIVQLPLPYDNNVTESILDEVSSKKDVDGFKIDSPFIPCTPKGVLHMLMTCNIDTRGKHVVIVGRSKEVGKPLARILSEKGYDATVTLCHSKTPDISVFTKQADIVISAVGKPFFIKADMIRDGAVCIDIGINQIPDSTKKSGYRLVGDFDFSSCIGKASYITPTPGGTGPLTVLSLLANTIKAFELFNKF